MARSPRGQQDPVWKDLLDEDLQPSRGGEVGGAATRIASRVPQAPPRRGTGVATGIASRTPRALPYQVPDNPGPAYSGGSGPLAILLNHSCGERHHTVRRTSRLRPLGLEEREEDPEDLVRDEAADVRAESRDHDLVVLSLFRRFIACLMVLCLHATSLQPGRGPHAPPLCTLSENHPNVILKLCFLAHGPS